MHVICKGEEAIVGRVINGKTEVSIEFKDFNLTVQMTSLQVDDIKQQSSVIGKQDLSDLAIYLNLNADLYIPDLNALIPVIHIPQVMDGVKIETATFQAVQNYMYLTFSPIHMDDFEEIWTRKFKENVFGARHSLEV